MRWLAILVAVLAVSGCSDSRDSTAPDSAATSETAGAPSAYTKLMSQLPAFDEPASAEVTAYRIAAIEARTARCTRRTGGADRAAFLRANAEVLASAGAFPGAQLVSQLAVPHRDGNGCPEGSGPPSYFTTDRAYTLPFRTTSSEVLSHYQRLLHYGWLETTGTTPCERNFAQAAAFIVVDACGGALRLEALGRAPVVTSTARRLPPRPFGLQYPPAADVPSADAPPTSYDVTSGETCERGVGVDVPSIILPPPPGVRAELRGSRVVIEWSFARILGDCPPMRLVLSVESRRPGASANTARTAVHESSGTTELQLTDSFRNASVLRATTESVDGTRSRPVTVLIRRQT